MQTHYINSLSNFLDKVSREVENQMIQQQTKKKQHVFVTECATTDL